MKKIEFNNKKNVIYNQLKTARKNKGLSQANFAVKMQLLGVNMDQQMISKIERNMRIVTDYELVCLCKVLSVNEKYLLKDFYDNIL